MTIENLAITGGKVLGDEYGGGIRNRGNLTLNRCTIAGNSAENNGGGIDNAPGAVMVINDSTISENQLLGGTKPVSGGGITNEGSLTIRNSTVSGNTSSNDGGGIDSSGTLNLDSVTVTGNTASGANLGNASGAGVFIGAFGTLTSRNSNLAGNSGAEDCSKIKAATDGDHNLVQTQAGCGFTNGVNGNIVGQPALLGPLHDNGGPTKTHALLTGNPAIDHGDTTLTTDQRGFSRPAGPADDIGAFEEAQLGKITVIKATYAPDTTNFEFTLMGGVLPSPLPFKLDTSVADLDSINSSQSFQLPAGAYSVTEAVPPAQTLGPVAISCVDKNGLIGSFVGATANIALQAYQDVTCTFTNDTIYRIRATAVGNGSVSCSPSFVGKGKRSTCIAVPLQGFRVKKWTGGALPWAAVTSVTSARSIKTKPQRLSSREIRTTIMITITTTEVI